MRSRGLVALLVALVLSNGACSFAGSGASSCPADITGDDTVDGGDLGLMLGAWGPCIEGCFGCLPDLDGDCFVDGADLGMLLGAWGPCFVPGFDIAVEKVTVTPTPILEGQTAAIEVDVSNSGDTDEIVILVVTAAGSTPNCALLVPAHGVAACTVAVVVPGVPTSCGDITMFPVLACAVVEDDDDSNDCGSSVIEVLPAYADLVFEVANAPETAQPCEMIGWTIQVTNVGTATSPNLCFMTAMDCAPGAGQYGCSSSTRNFSTGAVAPAQTKSFQVSEYLVSCKGVIGTQWIKVEFDADGNCFEPCVNGNYDEAPVKVGQP